MDGAELAAELAELAERMYRAPDPEQTAEQVVAYAREQLGADHAGITLIGRGGRLETVAPTEPIVEQADMLQNELAEGPCYDSAWHGSTLVSQDLAAERRWPTWTPKALALGISSVLGVELLDQSGEHRLGAMNVYWATDRLITADEVAVAHLISRHAALALDGSLKVKGLNVALDGRKRIGQAQGILMERHGLDEDQAFAVLRRYSQNHNIKLRALAETLVVTRKLPAYGPAEKDPGPDAGGTPTTS
ncbi:GAF and ANTAR domain-containing protein [Nocardioides terrisoli]|uniref:GAF and ANTAR domain-containing protein n=1 Tax=Nocardioides terrisoli TaxID=3388267 RepID=UPI00287B838F|nr:GAF and ANTAR domain-containing protein [Nocardioides marmorisolisilvae]